MDFVALALAVLISGFGIAVKVASYWDEPQQARYEIREKAQYKE